MRSTPKTSSGSTAFGLSPFTNLEYMHCVADTQDDSEEGERRFAKIAPRFSLLSFAIVHDLTAYILLGSESLLHSLVDRMPCNLGISFSSLVALKLDSSLRNSVSEAIVPDSGLKVIKPLPLVVVCSFIAVGHSLYHLSGTQQGRHFGSAAKALHSPRR